MTGPASPERVTIRTESGTLEAVAEDAVAEEFGGPVRRCAVVCHPHPQFGGTMENKVVTTVARALRDSGIPTIRFNFRGVGASSGVFDQGIGETADAAAAAAWCRARWPEREIVLAGFSFGAYVALRLAQQTPPNTLITIAPPVDRFEFSSLKPPACPWWVVQGDADEVVNPHSVFEWVHRQARQPQLIVMTGVGHFFHGRLAELKDSIRRAVATHGGGSGGAVPPSHRPPDSDS